MKTFKLLSIILLIATIHIFAMENNNNDNNNNNEQSNVPSLLNIAVQAAAGCSLEDIRTKLPEEVKEAALKEKKQVMASILQLTNVPYTKLETNTDNEHGSNRVIFDNKNNNLALTIRDKYNNQRTFKVWNLKTVECTETSTLPIDEDNEFEDYSLENGQIIAKESITEDLDNEKFKLFIDFNGIHIFDAQTKKHLQTIPSINSQSLFFSVQTQDTIIYQDKFGAAQLRGEEYGIKIVDLETGTCLKIIPLRFGTHIQIAALNKDQSLLLAGSVTCARLWDLQEFNTCKYLLENALSPEQEMLLVPVHNAIKKDTQHQLTQTEELAFNALPEEIKRIVQPYVNTNASSDNNNNNNNNNT